MLFRGPAAMDERKNSTKIKLISGRMEYNLYVFLFLRSEGKVRSPCLLCLIFIVGGSYVVLSHKVLQGGVEPIQLVTEHLQSRLNMWLSKNPKKKIKMKWRIIVS